MLEEFQEDQRKKLTRTRSIVDWTMGILFLLLGLYFLLYRYIDLRIMDREPSDMDFMIGGLFIVYAAWRMYRGYKKDYFK